MSIKRFTTTYFPGILMFLIAMLIGLLTYKDYGMSWDEPDQRVVGMVNFNYVRYSDPELLSFVNKEYGAGFELPLVLIERKMKITDIRDVYLMRHLVTHIFFLIGVFFAYVLIYRLFKSRMLACLGFFMLAFMPRIYAHSFFNTKDTPFLAVLLIAFTVCQVAFEEKKAWLFLMLGAVCGYATGIRIMGILLFAIILFFLIIDLITAGVNKEKPRKVALNMLLFLVSFFLFLLVSWPYLWKAPYANFVNAYNRMQHFIWEGKVLVNGQFLMSNHLPWTYFHSWFLVTNPVLWLIAGFAGIIWLAIDIVLKPLHFLKNTNDRNFLIYLACFFAPILAVIFLHAIVYDEWRHLYFVYPSFILMGLYFINKFAGKKVQLAILGACLVQVAGISYFMIKYHPVQQVYFNSLVSHDKEYLRKNYEFEYWGACYMQALQHLAAIQPEGIIKVCYGPGGAPLRNNILMLREKDRNRVQIVEENQADYFITNYRWHPDDFPNPVVYSITVLNSTAVCVYKVMH